MKRKLLILSLAFVLILSLSAVAVAEDKSSKEIQPPMTKEEFLETFTQEEIQAWQMSKKFVSEQEQIANEFFMVKKFELPSNEQYIEKLDEDEPIYKVHIFYDYVGDEGKDYSFSVVTLERISDVKWQLIDYSSGVF